jgi:hypothetical protein
MCLLIYYENYFKKLEEKIRTTKANENVQEPTTMSKAQYVQQERVVKVCFIKTSKFKLIE